MGSLHVLLQGRWADETAGLLMSTTTANRTWCLMRVVVLGEAMALLSVFLEFLRIRKWRSRAAFDAAGHERLVLVLLTPVIVCQSA